MNPTTFHRFARPRLRSLLTGCLGVLLALASHSVTGQQGDPPEDSVTAGLERITAEIQTLTEQLDSARGENRDPIRLRLWTQQEQYRQLAWQHVDGQQPDNASATVPVKELLSAVSTALRRQIGTNADRIAELQVAVESAEGAEADRHRDALRIAETHRMALLSALVGNVTRMQRFGLPATDDATQATVLFFKEHLVGEAAD